MTPVRGVLSILVLGACGGPGAVAPDAPAVVGDAAPATCAVDLSAELVPIAAQYGLPALGVIASDDAGVLGCGVTGVRKDGDATLATVDDRWHLGSDTKAMTATLFAQAVEAGTLAWDTTLPEAFPGRTIDPGYAAVTLPMLLSHVGGAPGDVPGDIWAAMWGAGAAEDLRMDAVEAMLARAPGASVGSFTYANAGYMMVGAALEIATGLTWEALTEQRLFAPLGMASCGFGPNATEGTVDAPWGHQVGGGGALVPLNADNPPALGPAGTVHCSLADWMRFVREHVDGANGEATALGLSAASWTALQTPWSGTDYAGGWIVTTRPWGNGTVLTHMGSNTLNVATVWWAPATRRIYASVTNRGDAAAQTGADAALGVVIERFPG